jgi:hypothetical protein
MATFMQNLGNNPSGAGIYNQPNQDSNQDPMDLVNRLKDREMMDFKNKAAFLKQQEQESYDTNQVRQGKLRSMFDPNGAMNVQQPNVQMGQDPNAMTGYEKGELGIRQQGVAQKQQEIGQEGQKIAQAGKMGEERLGIQSAQEKLNQQKSDQINATKQADLERKTDEANQKLQLAQQALDAKTKAGEDALQQHKDLAAAVEERHRLEMDKMQHKMDQQEEQFKTLRKQHDDLMKQNRNTKQTTELSPDGTKKTVTTQKGGTVQVKGKDGNMYEIPADKEDEWNQNHSPEEDDSQK